MKTYAGDIYLELPGAWNNESNYVYREPSSDIEVRVERSPVGPAATPDTRLQQIEERLKLLGPLEKSERGEIVVDGHQARTLSIRCKRPPDKEASLMEVLVVKASPSEMIAVTVLGPASKQASILSAWRHVLSKTKIVEVR